MFDRYVSGTKPSWKRRALVIASIAVHGVAAVVLLIWSVLHVDEIAPPALSLTFFSAPPPPPPPPPPAGHKSVERKKPTPTRIQQPTEIPKLVQPKEPEKPEEEGEGEVGGVEGGVKGGVAGGVVGGVVGGQLGGTGTAPPPPKPKNVPAYQLDQQAIYKPEPHLPDVIKIQRKGTGDAVFTAKMCVGTDGKVFQVSVLQGIPGADESILTTVRQWRYKPLPIPLCSVTRWVFSIQ